MSNRQKIVDIPFGNGNIGMREPVKIIAEIGVNHEGDIGRCKDMIQMAAEAGVDAIKLQTADPDEHYQKGTESHNIFSKAMLTKKETAEIFQYCREKNILPMTTCGDVSTLDFINSLEPVAHKVSSGLAAHHFIVRKIAETGRPVFISTGMASLSEIAETVNVARETGNPHIALMQCVSLYPCPPDLSNLAAIRMMSDHFGAHVGYSDHSIGVDVPVFSVAAGARFIEKHFSSDPHRPGFDHAISADYAALKDLIIKVRYAELMLGDGSKVLHGDQLDVAKRYQRFLVARVTIEPSEPLSLDNIVVQRVSLPQASFLPAKSFDNIIGKHVNHRIEAGEALKLSDIKS